MYWYLSFADPSKPRGKQWLGGCYVKGDDIRQAMLRAWEAGCNPGGQIYGIPVENPGDAFVDRLLNKEQLRAIGDDPTLINLRGEEI